MELIYLDHASTTPVHPAVVEIMTEQLTTTFGNPSSTHSFGRVAYQKLEEVRRLIAQSLQVSAHEIIFNSGGTEGANTAIIESALARRERGLHVITTMVEHPAVLRSMNYLETLGFEVTYLPVNEQGELSLAEVEAVLREETILVSIMYANNETGVLFPIREIGELLHNHPAVFHTDAVQVYGVKAIHPNKLGVDLMSISAHKFNGPKGVGFLYKRDTIPLPPLLHGGLQEENRRAGTENVTSIIGMGKAIELLGDKEQRLKEYRHYESIIVTELKKQNIAFQINGNQANKLPNIMNIYVKEVDSDLLLMNLDLQGIAVSIGSACSAGVVEASHVLEAMYGTEHPANTESIRVSFGQGTNEQQIMTFTQAVGEIIRRIN